MANEEKKAPTIVRFYRFRNRLKEKTHGLGGGKGGISPEAMEKAEKALETLSEDYPDWVSGLITNWRNNMSAALIHRKTARISSKKFTALPMI
ncbi:hypothetical protein JCM17845_18290 [Iodidimonas gelatinilytica]|uniref:Uncharacterized protein n=1 Tax=Iodidimonas gelatinilytica TaxID=1236966 RepID=A0A5A7N2B8_9PROT|nr:hypothetical protein JCM17845_18290 [Iodidimonas gelatinilytica]